MKFAVLLVAVGFAAASVLKVDPDLAPVERVVVLLRELKDRITEDGAKEQMIYNKYSCWCEKTSARKASSIDAARDQLRALGQEILAHKGTVATRTSEIEKLMGDIKDNEDGQKEATTIRQEENAEYMAETSEMKQALASLDKALTVLGAALPSAALLQGDAAASARAAVALRDFFAEVPARATEALAAKQLALLRQAAHLAGKAGYAPQSGTISGILSEMYSTLSKDLETMTQEEAERNTSYEGLMAAKQSDLKEMQKSMRKKEEEKAEAETLLAEATANFDDTEAQMKADVEFFDATKKACEEKSEEWSERKSLRDEEVKGINEAIKILSSDEARDLFHNAIKPGIQSFLQLGSVDSWAVAASPARKSAYQALKTHAVRAGSLRLATLAARVRTGEGGHFDEVMKAIDDMVQTLKDEASSDAAKRDQCKEEFQKIDSKLADLDWKIEKNEAKIAKLEDLIEKREVEKAKTIEDIIDVKKQIKTMEDQRDEENAAFVQAKSDDEQAIVLLKQAKVALAAYYEKNDIPLDLVQKKDGPEFAEDPDVAPDATFSDKGKRRVESKGIVSILAMVIEDLNGEIKEGVRNEAAAVASFETALGVAKKLQGELETKKVGLEETIARRQGEKTDEKELLKTNTGDRDEQQAYEKEIKPDCDWIVGAFAERAKKRAAEMEGLGQAKDFLAGYKAEQRGGGGALLLQVEARSRPTRTMLRSVRAA